MNRMVLGLAINLAGLVICLWFAFAPNWRHFLFALSIALLLLPVLVWVHRRRRRRIATAIVVERKPHEDA